MSGLQELYFAHINQVVYTGQLENGLQVTMIPKPGFKETTAVIKVDFGSVDNEFTTVDNHVNQPYGLAHFLEHQVFENHGREDFSQKFSQIGADSNAFTGFTSTNYYFAAIDDVEAGLDLLLTLVSQDRFTELSMSKEKGIIKQEIDMYQDDPDYRLYSGALSGLFPQTALAVDIAGTNDSIQEIDYKDLTTAFSHFYRWDNMELVIVGDVAVDSVYERLKSFSLFEQTKEHPLVSKEQIAYNPIIQRQSLRSDVIKPKLALAFRPHQPLVRQFNQSKLALKLYLSMLLGWTSSAYQDWYDSGKVDDSFDYQVEVNERFQFVMVTLDTDEPIAMSAKIKQLLKQNKVSKDVSEEHFLSLKKEFYGDFLATQDKIEDLAVSYLEHCFDQECYFDVPRMLEQLSLSEVVDFGRQFFQQADVVDFTIFPK